MRTIGEASRLLTDGRGRPGMTLLGKIPTAIRTIGQ